MIDLDAVARELDGKPYCRLCDGQGKIDRPSSVGDVAECSWCGRLWKWGSLGPELIREPPDVLIVTHSIVPIEEAS